MKRALVFLFILVLALSAGLLAQSTNGGGTQTSGNPRGAQTSGSPPDRGAQPVVDPRTDGPDTLPRVLYISGKVVTDDGTPLADRVLIQSNCEGAVKTEGYTDQKGAFSFEFGNTRNRVLSDTRLATDTTTNVTFPQDMRKNDPLDWRKCELKAVASGFTSQVVDLGTRPPAYGNVNIGNIALHRMVPVQGLTISANSAQAPVEARKDYEKGLEEKKNGNLDAAQQRFHKALDAYPQYAVAWLELGRVQVAQKDITGARQSLHQSIVADDKLLGPYQELAQLAARDKRWQEVADTTDQLLKLDPANFAEFWFYNCVAKYYLGNVDAAENSALQGIKVDTQHRVPKMEYVLGQILVAKKDYPGAAEHLQKYLSLAPTGPDAANAQKTLEEINKSR